MHSRSKLLTKNKPIMRNDFSQNAKGLLSKLLQQNPAERLGSGETDAEEIKKHPFFSKLDWNMLKKKEITPEFIPIVQDAHDVRNIDSAFTKAPIHDTPISSGMVGSADNKFTGFTFNKEANEAAELLAAQHTKVDINIQP